MKLVPKMLWAIRVGKSLHRSPVRELRSKYPVGQLFQTRREAEEYMLRRGWSEAGLNVPKVVKVIVHVEILE